MAGTKRDEEKYYELINLIDQGFFIIDVIFDENNKPIDLYYVESSKAAIKMLGLDYTGKRLREIDPSYEEYWYEIFGNVALTGQGVRMERYAEPDKRWYSFNIFKIGDEKNNRIGNMFLDITERKQMEDTLREHKEKQNFMLCLSDTLRPLSDPLEIHGAVTRTARDFLCADRCYYCEITDDVAVIRQDASCGDLPSIAGVYPLGSLPIHKSLIDAGLPFIVPDVYTTKLVDEELRQLCIQLKVISYLDVPVIKNGKPVGILCITQCLPRDWTEFEVELAVEIAERTWAATEQALNINVRKKLEGDLRYQKELLESVIENMNDALVVFNKEGRIEFMNAESRKMYPYLSRHTSVDNFYNGFECYNLENNIIPVSELPTQQALNGYKIKNKKILIKHPDKDLFAEVNAVPIFDRKGNLVTAVITHHDITDSVNDQRMLKEQQEQLLKAEKEKSETLQEAIKLKDEFLYLITHEFKTPITVISSIIQSVDSFMKIDVSEKLGRYLAMIKINTNRQLRLVNNLLDIAKMSSNNIKFNIEKVDIVYVTKAIVKSVEVYAAQKSINISFTSSIPKKEI